MKASVILKISCIAILLQGCNLEKQTIAANKNIDYKMIEAQLITALNADQKIRDVDFNEMDSLSTVRFNRDLKSTDSLNQSIVVPILKKYGWLPKSKIGAKGSQALYLVIQHSDIKLIQIYLPQMEKLAKRGEASMIDAATMRDRLLMFKNKKQIYGTQAANWIRKDGSTVIWPIKNPAKVDMLRKSAGFKYSVSENAIRLHADYNPKENLPLKNIFK